MALLGFVFDFDFKFLAAAPAFAFRKKSTGYSIFSDPDRHDIAAKGTGYTFLILHVSPPASSGTAPAYPLPPGCIGS